MDKGMSYEKYLDENGTLTYSNVGVSMLPLLRQGKDLFTVRKKGDGRCRRGDVVLYKSPPNKYVLHRVIGVRKDDYVILGDNCITKEYGVRDCDIIGVMTGFVRSGREHSTDDLGYRLYTKVILSTISLRIFIKKLWLKTKRVLKRLIRGG